MSALLQKRIHSLEDELYCKTERIRELEAQIGMAERHPFPLGLTKSEGIIFNVLMKLPYPRKDTFMCALYSDKAAKEVQVKVVDVFICKMRRKLKRHGIEIKTQWGTAYYMPIESKIIANKIITEYYNVGN